MSNIRGKFFILLMIWVLGNPIVKGDPPPPPLPTNSLSLKSIAILINPAALQTNTPSASQTSSTNYIQENYDVRRFLEEAPPLRKIVYGNDATTYHRADYISDKDDPKKMIKIEKTAEDLKPRTGFVYYEAALQPTTFYNLLLAEMPGCQYSGKKRRSAAGCSTEVYWTLNYSETPRGVIPIIVISEKDNNSKNSKSVSAAAEEGLSQIDYARSLWINGLVPGTLRWVGEDHFEAKADGPVEVYGTDESKKVILGEITEKDSLNRPVKIKFICPALKGSPKFEHTYLYLSPVGKTKLPNLIVRRKDKFVGNDILTTFYTNTLVDIDIGISDLGPEGYVPGMFLESGKTNTAARQPMVVFIAKDGSRHIVEEGRSRKMPDNPITPDQLQLKPYRWKLLFACILLLIPILWKFIFLVIKNK
jgi:hypothetical protein